MLMRTEGIVTFVAVVECGSISRGTAVEAFEIRRQRASCGTRKTLGSLLLQRTTRKLTLTESGRAFWSGRAA